MTTWTVFKNATGDTGVPKQMTITNKDGSVRDLTGLTATFKVWKGDPAQPLLTVTGTNHVDIIDERNGVVQWTVQAADLAALPISLEGLFAEFQFTAQNYQDTAFSFTLLVLASA